LTDKDRQYINDKRISTVQYHSYGFIASCWHHLILKMTESRLLWGGIRFFIAQNATATCCRGCLGEWHHIEKGRALTDDEFGFVVDPVMRWIAGQIR